jgi:hypothetical protein
MIEKAGLLPPPPPTYDAVTKMVEKAGNWHRNERKKTKNQMKRLEKERKLPSPTYPAVTNTLKEALDREGRMKRLAEEIGKIPARKLPSPSQPTLLLRCSTDTRSH